MSLARVQNLFLVSAIFALSACSLSLPTAQSAAGSQTREVADAALQVGDATEAARLYERAAEQAPSDTAAFIGLGKSYTAMRQFNRAENALLRARELSPRNAEVHNSLGALSLYRMRPAEALSHYDKALSAERLNLAALTGKAISLDYLSRHGEAEIIYTEALRHYPTNFALLNNRALSLVLSGRIGEGTVLLQELVRDPQRGDTARTNMAIAYSLDGRVRDARAMLTGIMPANEVEAALRHYEKLRKDYLLGKPIGYLAFQ